MRGVAGGGDSSFGDGLATAARSIIADARRALTDPELSEPEAVHEVRKALKRWRALLRLLSRPLGEQADQLRTEARELMRAVAGARDAQSALDALADLRKADLPFSTTSTETIRARLTEMRDAAGATSFTKSTRERISRYLDYATLSLERWPLNAIDFDTVTDGLTSTYRRARQLVPEPDELPGCSTPRQNVKRGARPAPFGGVCSNGGCRWEGRKAFVFINMSRNCGKRRV